MTADCGHRSPFAGPQALCRQCAKDKDACQTCGNKVSSQEWRLWHRQHPPLGGYSAVFLDKDGTLVSDDGYPEIIPSDKVMLDRTVDGLNCLQNYGYKLIIVSNQSWIAKGKKTVQETEEIFQSVVQQYWKHGVEIDAYYYCPHPSVGDHCQCRKPKPGLLEKATRELNLNPHRSYMVGDLPTDIEAGKNFGIKTCLVRTGAPDARKQAMLKDLIFKPEAAPDYDVADVNAFVATLFGATNE